MIFPPIRIQQANSHQATNGPFGVDINTGTRYFAAVLLQEVYEARRYMAWYWLPLIPVFVAALFFGIFALSAAPIWMLLAGRQVLPFTSVREDRELFGQALEIAAIEHFYQRPDMAKEYRLQARSMLLETSSYKEKGFWSSIPAIPATVQWSDENASIDAMVDLLKTRAGEAKAYVADNIDSLTEWRPLGDESQGY